MGKINVDYDKDKDVIYIFNGKPKETFNATLDDDIVMRMDNSTKEILGFTITNFSYVFPKLVKHATGKSKWFIEEFFEIFLREFDQFVKALSDKRNIKRFFEVEKINKVGI